MKQQDFIKSRGRFLQNSKGKVPQKREVYNFIDEIIGYLFPILSDIEDKELEKPIDDILNKLKKLLCSYDSKLDSLENTISEFKESLPEIYNLLTSDAVAIYEGDPAAESIEEVIICYPGFYAITVYRIAHQLNNLSIPVIPRILSEYAHSKTGIDIHAKAKIGESFCIDHGTGIVIGETSKIGNSVKIYQGVTIGALSVSKDFTGTKRHPTIEDNAVIYAGSTILGGNTIIGHDTIIGGNVWLTQSVEPHSIVLNQNKIYLKNKQTNKNNVVDFVI